jgi:hypothetical protein
VPLAFAPVRRPRLPSPEASRNPRPCSFRGRPRPVTRRSLRPRHALAHRARRAGRTCPPSVLRFVRDLPPSCAVPQPEYHTIVTTDRAFPLFKRSPRLLAPPDLAPVVLPRRRGRRRQAAALLRFWATARVISFLRARSTSPSHALSHVSPPLAGVRADAAAAAGHHRAPTPATSPPQPRPPPNPR